MLRVGFQGGRPIVRRIQSTQTGKEEESLRVWAARVWAARVWASLTVAAVFVPGPIAERKWEGFSFRRRITQRFRNQAGSPTFRLLVGSASGQERTDRQAAPVAAVGVFRAS